MMTLTSIGECHDKPCDNLKMIMTTSECLVIVLLMNLWWLWNIIAQVKSCLPCRVCLFSSGNLHSHTDCNFNRTHFCWLVKKWMLILWGLCWKLLSCISSTTIHWIWMVITTTFFPDSIGPFLDNCIWLLLTTNINIVNDIWVHEHDTANLTPILCLIMLPQFTLLAIQWKSYLFNGSSKWKPKESKHEASKWRSFFR